MTLLENIVNFIGHNGPYILIGTLLVFGMLGLYGEHLKKKDDLKK